MINEKYNELFTLWVKENYDRIIERWIGLVKIPSVKSEAAKCAPFGENCSKALNQSAMCFALSGFNSEVFETGGYAVVSYGEGDKKIGLFCHSDVVPASDDWLYTSAFEPIVKGGALIGRGVEDNKAGIIASLCVLEFFKENNIPLKNNIEVFIGSDEECGMKDMAEYLVEHTMPDISIVPDADFPCSVGEKGIFHFWLESQNSFKDIIDFCGGEAFNIVLDSATVTIKYNEDLFNELKFKAENDSSFAVYKENSMIILKAKGVAKHASIPEGSINAAYLCAKLLSECVNLNSNDKTILTATVTALSSYYGNGIGVDHEDENFGKTTAVNGMVKVADNKKLCLSFDVRYGDTLSAEKLEEDISLTANKLGFVVTDKNNSQGFSIDKDSKIPSLLEDVFFEVTGERLNRVLMSGGTYARKLNNAFSIGTSYITFDRKDKVLKMPEGHGGPHQCDEMIDIEGFFMATRILMNYIIACDEFLG